MTGRPGADAASAPVAAGIRLRAAGPAIRASLAPVRTAMLRRAQDEADELVRRARQQAAEAVARARADAENSVASAREAGLAQATPLAAAVRNRRRRDVRATVLAAQREAHDELRRQVRAAVDGLPDEPGYSRLLDRLRRSARQAAGASATISDDPAGGVVARGPGVVVDCSLPRLADAAVDALGPRTDWLWTPGTGRRGAAGPPGPGAPAPARGPASGHRDR